MKTSRAKAYYQDYMYAVNKYGYRHLSDCYKKPSYAKVNAERAIAYRMYIRDGYGYSVISYNTNMFTCGYLFNRDGELWFAVHTPIDCGEIKVQGD